MLSPVDIQNKVFKKAKIGGYNINDVTEFFEEVLKSYQELTNENYALKDKMNVLNESIQYYRTMETTIQNVLVLADKTAQETKSTAYEKAEQIKKEAEQRAEKVTYSAEERANKILDKGRQDAFELTQKVDDIKAQYMSYRVQFKQMLQGQLEILEQSEVTRLTREEETFTEEMVAVTEQKGTLDTDVFKALELNEQEKYYTKEYMPVGEEIL